MEKNRAYSVLELIGWGKYNIFAFIQCGLAWCTFSIWFINSAFVIQGTTQEWDLNTLQAGIIGSFLTVGLLFGSLFWGYIANRYGRMHSFKSSVVVVFSSSILLVLSPNFYTVAGALTVLGFGMAGEITLAGTVFYEFCPPSKRYYMTLMSLFLVSGNIIETFIALMVSLFNNTGFYNWRVISAVGVVIEGCAMVSRFFMHETPAFLVSQNKQSAADEILNIICIKNTGKSLDRIENQASLNPNELTQEDKPIRNKEKTTGKMMRVFKPPLLKTTSFLGLVYLFASFSYAGITQFMPEYLKEFSTSTSYAIILAQQCCGIPGVLISSKLVETRLGRRYTLTIFYFISGILIVVFSLSDIFWYVLPISCAFYLTITIGYSSMFTIAPESFPTSIRSTGVSILNVFSRIGGIVSPIIAGYFLELPNGKFLALLTFCITYSLSGLCVLALKETRGNRIG